MGIGGREDPEADWTLTVGLALVGLWVDVEGLGWSVRMAL